MTLKTAWPAPVQIKGPQSRQVYATPDGDFPRVTQVLKVLGLGTEGLIAWAAREERKAVMEAAVEVYASGEHEDGPTGFLYAVEQRLGPARQHQKQIAKAADIGTAIHEAIRARTMNLLGEKMPEPVLTDEAQWGFMAWEDWFKSSKLYPVKAEQVIWHPELGYAGTIDLIARRPDGKLVIIDYKTGKAIYLQHHLQGVAYLQAARLWDQVETVQFVKLPKDKEDTGVSAVELGVDDYSKRVFSEDELWTAFQATLQAWKVLCKP